MFVCLFVFYRAAAFAEKSEHSYLVVLHLYNLTNSVILIIFNIFDIMIHAV